MSQEPIICETRDTIAWITLNRPDVLNAFDEPQRERLVAALQAADDDAEVSVVVLAASGDRAFSAGADQKAGHGFTSPQEYRAKRRRSPFVTTLDSMQTPVLAAIHGHCIGLGLELALACDIRVASLDATFSLPEVAVGLIPSSGVSKRLGAIVGLGRALDIVLTGRRLGAEEALSIGLVNRTVERTELEVTVRSIAQSIAANAPLAVRSARERLRAGLDQTLDEAVRAETDALSLLVFSEDRAEAAAAFRDKRKPVFKGR